jgi:hypothetical protein
MGSNAFYPVIYALDFDITQNKASERI